MQNEINATAGQAGTSYTIRLDARDPHVRVNGGPNRVAQVINVDGSALRHATVDNHGEYGDFEDLDPGGSSFDVTPEHGSRVFMLANPSVGTVVRVVIS